MVTSIRYVLDEKRWNKIDHPVSYTAVEYLSSLFFG